MLWETDYWDNASQHVESVNSEEHNDDKVYTITKDYMVWGTRKSFSWRTTGNPENSWK